MFSTGQQHLWEIFPHCPTWTLAWQRTLDSLHTNGSSCYNHLSLFKENGCVVARQNGEVVFCVKDNNPQLLFAQCHQRLAALWDVFVKIKGQCPMLRQSLLSVWRTDKVWCQTIRSLHTADVSTRYLPRLLSERKHALVLHKTNDEWRTRKNRPAKQVINASLDDKRQALEMLMDLPLLRKIEIPKVFDYDQLLPVLNTLKNGLKSTYAIDHALAAKCTPWSLAFRRVQGMGFKGCFDAASQTIIVDPRHMNTLLHEFCHWLLGHDIHVGKSLTTEEDQVEHLLDMAFGHSTIFKYTVGREDHEKTTERI